MQRLIAVLAMTILVAGCIADAKLPPDPTVEYLPCSGMSLSEERTDPSHVLTDVSIWAGFWTEGDQWHVGVTDAGGVNWAEVCPQIGDEDLTVHEAPFTMAELERWETEVSNRMSNEADSASLDVELAVVNGQWVLEMFAKDLSRATEMSIGVPFSAWIHGGQVRDET
jgi:hypothetical protein